MSDIIHLNNQRFFIKTWDSGFT